VVLSYPDQFLQQVGLDLFIVDPLGYGGVRVGATWPDEDPEPPEGWAPAALLATVTSGYVGYSAVITAPRRPGLRRPAGAAPGGRMGVPDQSRVRRCLR
jgi:hypothetical protein